MDDDVVETSDIEELEELRAPFSYAPFEKHNTSPKSDGPSPRKRIKLCHTAFPFTSEPSSCVSQFKTPEKKRQSGSPSLAGLTVTQISVEDAGSTSCTHEAHSPSSQCLHDPLLLKTPPITTNVIAFSEGPNLSPESSFVNHSNMNSLFTPPSSNNNSSPAKRNHIVVPSSPPSAHSMPSSPLTVLWSPPASNNQRAPSPLSATHLDQHSPQPSFSEQHPSNPPEQINMHEMPDDDSRNVSRYPLRPRQPVQLHPYFIEKVHYKQALQGNPEAMVLVRSPERNHRVQEYEGTQIETQETEYTPVSRGDRSRSRSPSYTRSQNVLRPTESEQSPVHYPEILQDLPSSDSEEKEARREVSKEIRKTQKGQIRGHMQHLRNPKSFPLLLAGAVGSKKRRDSSGSDAFHAPQNSSRFRRSVVGADREGGDDILPAVAPSRSSSPTISFQHDVLSPVNAEWLNQDLNQMVDASGEPGGLDDFDSQSSDQDVPTSRESTPDSKKVILDKKRLKALGRMLPKSMINGLIHGRALPQNRQRSATVVSEEGSEEALLPGQTRVRRTTHTRLVQDVRGDSDSSEEGRSTGRETTSSDVEIISSKWTRDVITVSDTENDSGNGFNGSSDEDIGDEDIQAYMDDDPQSDAREVNLIDRMLSRTWTVGNGTKSRSTTRVRRPRKKKYALDIVTGGARKHNKSRQLRLNFDNHISAPKRSGFRPAPARHDKASDAFQYMTETAKRQRKRTNQRHKANGLYVFSGEGKRRIISGRREIQPVSVDTYVDTREVYSDWGDAFQPSSSLRDRAIIHQVDRNHRAINALAKNRRRNVAGDEEKLFSADDDDAIAPTSKAHSNMGVQLLPPGITFGDQTYIGKRRLDQLIGIFSSTMRIPELVPCDLRGYNLRTDMTLGDFSRTLHCIREDFIEFSTGLPEVDQVERVREWDIVSRAVFQLLSWFRISGDDEQRKQLQQTVESNASAIVDHIRELDLTSKSLDSAILQLDWFTVELLARAGCKISLPGSDTVTSNIFHRTLSLLVDHLIELNVPLSVRAVMLDNPLTSSSLAQECAELWVCLIHLLGAYPAQATQKGIKPPWSLILTSLQKRDEQSNLKASEKVWETIFCLNALSQFSVYGMTTSQPRLPAAWPLVVFALKKIRLAANAVTDKNLSAATLIQRDKYIGVITFRCFQLCDKWKWQLDDASEVFNELGETFRSRKFANLRHEKPDYPLFMLRSDWSLLSQGAKRDSAFALFLKLIVKAGKSESSSELSPKFKKFLSLAIPVGSLPFTKATPPSKEDLSMLFNRFSAVAIGIYLDRASYKTRISHARTYVAFANADTTTRMAVIRGMMNLANLIRTIELPLGSMAEWISDISLALADELKSMPMLPNEPKINQEQQPQSVGWCHLHICIQMLLSSIRRILGLQSENREYPEPTLISSLKPLYTNIRLSHEPKTMHEIQRLTTVLLNARSNALPLPERPLIVSDANTESQDEYNAAFAAFDFDDPDLIAALVDGGAAGLPVHKAHEEKLYSVINDTNLFWLCWRNLTKLIQDMNEKPLTTGRLRLLDNRIFCWLGCADVLVRNGSGKSWTMILGQRDEVWKITNEVLRRRVDLGVAMQLLKLDPMMYTVGTPHMDMFLEVFLESFAAEEYTIEHEYASLLLSIDGLRHPLLQGLMCMERPGHEDYNISEHEYSALKSVILQTIFRNLNGLLEHEEESSSIADSGLRNQKFMGYCIKCFSAMRSISSGLVKESQVHKSYIEWCKQVFRSIQELEHIRSHPRLVYWISWARALDVT